MGEGWTQVGGGKSGKKSPTVNCERVRTKADQHNDGPKKTDGVGYQGGVWGSGKTGWRFAGGEPEVCNWVQVDSALRVRWDIQKLLPVVGGTFGIEGNGDGEGRFDEYMKWGSGADYIKGRGVERVECLGSNTQGRKILGAED